MSGNPIGGAGGPRPPYGDHDLCGVYYGIVTQNDDLKGPGGRVKVRFPWMPKGERDQSHWAPVCVPMVGDRYGTYFMPEIEDAVYVVFIAGDIGSPVVIGGAWSKEDDPPEVNEDGKNDFRVIKSRSGHRLLFDDTDQTKLVVSDRKDENYVACGPHAEAGSSPRNTYGVASPPAVNGSPSQGVSVGALEGKLNIWCPGGTLTLEGTHVEITASGAGDVKAASVKADAGSRANVISSSKGKFKGSAIKIGR